jgi:hypothetical protein
MQFVRVDSKRIVNLDQVALARFVPEHKATKSVYSDIDGKDHPIEYVEPDKLELVLVAPSDSGYNSSEGTRVIITNADARALWEYLCQNTLIMEVRTGNLRRRSRGLAATCEERQTGRLDSGGRAAQPK